MAVAMAFVLTFAFCVASWFLRRRGLKYKATYLMAIGIGVPAFILFLYAKDLTKIWSWFFS